MYSSHSVSSKQSGVSCECSLAGCPRIFNLARIALDGHSRPAYDLRANDPYETTAGFSGFPCQICHATTIEQKTCAHVQGSSVIAHGDVTRPERRARNFCGEQRNPQGENGLALRNDLGYLCLWRCPPSFSVYKVDTPAYAGGGGFKIAAKV